MGFGSAGRGNRERQETRKSGKWKGGVELNVPLLVEVGVGRNCAMPGKLKNEVGFSPTSFGEFTQGGIREYLLLDLASAQQTQAKQRGTHQSHRNRFGCAAVGYALIEAQRRLRNGARSGKNGRNTDRADAAKVVDVAV